MCVCQPAWIFTLGMRLSSANTLRMFQLTKWYLDLVTDSGDAVIGYAARLTVAGVPLTYASMLSSCRGEANVEHANMRAVTFPSFTGDVCDWRQDAFEVAGRWERRAPPIVRSLLDDGSSAITWSCHMPSAHARLRVGNISLEGLGYVECLEATLPKLALPFRTLHWGRYLSPGHAMVWIQWDDGHDCRFVWLDGALQPDARIIANGITGLSNDRELRLHASRDLQRRAVVPAIGRVLPLLLPHIDASLAQMHEHKLLSRGRMFEAGQHVDEGWVLHEVVRL